MVCPFTSLFLVRLVNASSSRRSRYRLPAHTSYVPSSSTLKLRTCSCTRFGPWIARFGHTNCLSSLSSDSRAGSPRLSTFISSSLDRTPSHSQFARRLAGLSYCLLFGAGSPHFCPPFRRWFVIPFSLYATDLEAFIGRRTLRSLCSLSRLRPLLTLVPLSLNWLASSFLFVFLRWLALSTLGTLLRWIASLFLSIVWPVGSCPALITLALFLMHAQRHHLHILLGHTRLDVV
jgi:hypothetical protein